MGAADTYEYIIMDIFHKIGTFTQILQIGNKTAYFFLDKTKNKIRNKTYV